MNRLNRIICVSLGVVCFALAIGVQRKPTAAARQAASPSAEMLLSDPRATEEEELLSRPVPSLDFVDAPLGSVTCWLSDLDSATMVIDWESLHRLQIPSNVAVTVHLKNATLGGALRAVMDDLAARGFRGVDFAATGRGVQIGASESLFQSIQIEYFNVHALLDHLSADAGGAPADRETIAVQLCKAVSNIVDFASWRDSGGNNGSMKEIGGVLVIAQTRDNLASIRLLLDALDRARSSSELTPLMVGKTVAVFNARALMRGLEARQPGASGGDLLWTYIMNHFPRLKWDAGIAANNIGLVGGMLVIKGQDNIHETQNTLEELSRDLSPGQKR